MQVGTDTTFADEVRARSGQDIRHCYQCLKCFAGCPLADHMDYKPNAIIRMVQYGMREKVLSSHAVWLCVSCMTCGVRCPNDIDMSSVFDTLREMAREAGYSYSSEPNVVILHEEFVRNVKMWGRLHESTFFMPYMLRSLDLFSNAESGLALFIRGKLPMIPTQIRDIEGFWKMFERAYRTKGQLKGKE